MRNQVLLLVEIIESTRNITKYYLKNLASIDPTSDLKVGDTTLHSVNWTVCHLAWAQNSLLLESMGNNAFRQDWFSKVSIGSEFALSSVLPAYEANIEVLNLIHAASIEAISKLVDNDLLNKSKIQLPFSKESTIKDSILHYIRHEGMHAGHLSWLAKLNHLKLV